MKRLLFISLLPLSAFAGAQTILSHDGFVSHTASQGLNGGGGNDGAPYSHYVDVPLDQDSGLVASSYSHVGTGSSVTYAASGQSKNSLDALGQSYSVDLSTSLDYDVALNHSGYVNLDTLAVDNILVHLDTPVTLTLAWSASTDGSLDLYDGTFQTVFHANLASAGSTSLTLAAGDYRLLGSVEEYFNATGISGYPGEAAARSGSFSYQASVNAVPEPSAFAALGVGMVALLRRRK